MAESTPAFRTVPLGEIDPARSRHMWTRSSVTLTEGHAVVGQWDGTITAFDRDSLDTVWEIDHAESPASLLAVDDLLVAGGRGESGTIAAYDAATGEQVWSYATARDIGDPSSDRVFEQPYVVDVVATVDRLFAAARRYERTGDERRWHSAVYAFDRDGSVEWTYAVDASPISLAVDDEGDRLAVGYNRCLGDHDHGLVVLDTASGDPSWMWDPGTAGDRRVGDVAFDGDALAVASHGDKRGYLLDRGGRQQWRVDLAVPTEIDGETLYAYPNHVHAHDGRVAFLTGNTYAVESRETEGRHPHEHRLLAVDEDGEELWDADLGGFVHGLAIDGDRLVVPTAQNFRVRDAATHALRQFDLTAGETGKHSIDGIPTAAAVDGEAIAAVEEPIVYHDEGDERGGYRLHLTVS
ncbi:MAG: PQQ-binding-like beta-propeller repeat protein [Halohasta sp.]